MTDENTEQKQPEPAKAEEKPAEVPQTEPAKTEEKPAEVPQTEPAKTEEKPAETEAEEPYEINPDALNENPSTISLDQPEHLTDGLITTVPGAQNNPNYELAEENDEDKTQQTPPKAPTNENLGTPTRDRDFTAGFTFSQEARDRVAANNPGASFWGKGGILDRFRHARSPEEAFMDLFMNVLLYLPNVAVEMIEMKKAKIKARSEYAKEQRNIYENQIAQMKGLSDTERMRAIHQDFIKTGGNMAALAEKVRKENPNLMQNLGIEFDKNGKAQNITNEQKEALAKAVLTERYKELYNGILPSPNKLKDMWETYKIMSSSGQYAQMFQAEQAAQVVPNAIDADKMNAFHQDFTKAVGDMATLAEKLREEDPEFMQKLGIEFDKDGNAKNVTNEQREALANAILSGKYKDLYNGVLPSQDKMKDMWETSKAVSPDQYAQMLQPEQTAQVDPKEAEQTTEKVKEPTQQEQPAQEQPVQQPVVPEVTAPVQEAQVQEQPAQEQAAAPTSVREEMHKVDEKTLEERKTSNLKDAHKDSTTTTVHSLKDEISNFTVSAAGLKEQQTKVENNRTALETARQPKTASTQNAGNIRVDTNQRS